MRLAVERTLGLHDLRGEAAHVVGAALAGREQPAAGAYAAREPGGRVRDRDRQQRLDRNRLRRGSFRLVGGRTCRRKRPLHVDLSPVAGDQAVRPRAMVRAGHSLRKRSRRGAMHGAPAPRAGRTVAAARALDITTAGFSTLAPALARAHRKPRLMASHSVTAMPAARAGRTAEAPEPSQSDVVISVAASVTSSAPRGGGCRRSPRPI